MKIVLISLPQKGEVKDFTTPEYLRNDFVRYPPLGLLYIAAGVDKRHDIQVVDTVARGMDNDDVIRLLNIEKPDLLGISVTTGRLYAMHAIASSIRTVCPDITVIAGGPHVSAFPEETIDSGVIDYAITGFGDKGFPLFVETLDLILKNQSSAEALNDIPGLCYKVSGKFKKNPEARNSIHLDDFSFPDRRMINPEDYYSLADKDVMTTLTTSRGCPFRCVYCDIPEKRYYARSAENIVDEMEEIVGMGIKTIFIIDDTFNISRKRVMNMCNEILRRNLDVKWSARVRVYPFDVEMLSLMKRAGCKRLHVGVETLDPDILKAIKKKISVNQICDFFDVCKKLKIETLAYFIVGFPQETKQYRDLFFDKIKRLSPTYLYVNILYPATTSELYTDFLQRGIYKNDFWNDFIRNPVENFEVPLFRSPELHKELLEFADKMHRKFYFSPKFIINDLLHNFSTKTFGVKAKGALLLLYKTALKKYIDGILDKKKNLFFKRS